ncbi:MAG: DUF3604 domain-containing protein [bacterium]|nr:DUF3604 domain-containing protein [bacterium]
MNPRTQILSIGSIALLCVLASSGCEDVANVGVASKVSSGQSSGRVMTDDVIFEPIMDTMSLRPEANPERNVYYGDLHVHTEYSFDAFAFGTQATPRDAYRYAKGEAIQHPAGYEIKLSRPLDFYAVTDHAMFLGVAKEAADTSSELSRLPVSEIAHDLNAPDNRGLFTLATRAKVFGTLVSGLIDLVSTGEVERQEIDGISRSAWRDTIEAADEAYVPGRFTAFAGYEYTSSTSERGNLHRNVIFRGTDDLPELPFSRLNSRNPEGLWDWMDALREQGIESLAIPHNSNGSNGAMFQRVNWAGEPIDEAYAAKRMRNEPLVEVTQVKGTSETHPLLSDTDEWAGFEIMPYRVGTKRPSEPTGSYVRDAYRTGLEIAAGGAMNPYKFGLIGSTDTHVGGGSDREDDYFSKVGLIDATPERRGSIPAGRLLGLALSTVAPKLVNEVDGTTYLEFSSFEFWGASGLAAVWAEENTREAIYGAFRRKETFATSGPRIKLRFFAGYDFDPALLDAPDGVTRAYAEGVTMGADLAADGGRAPRFWVWALADPMAAPLQRAQVIKGWEEGGKSHEKVFDVACSDGLEVDPATHRCPDNGARVNLADCSFDPDKGAMQLRTLWQDPEFRADQEAFYYVRVLENPTCRWSTWEAVRAGVEPRSDLPKTVIERAWSSPIWYRPGQS